MIPPIDPSSQHLDPFENPLEGGFSAPSSSDSLPTIQGGVYTPESLVLPTDEAGEATDAVSVGIRWHKEMRRSQ